MTSGTRGGSRRRVAWGGQGQPEDPRSRIAEAAIRTLATHGLEHTSLTVIAREAQVSRQTVYAYFSTKEEIAEIALERAGHRRRRPTRGIGPHRRKCGGVRGGVVSVGGAEFTAPTRPSRR